MGFQDVTEQELIQACLKHDQAAQKELYDRYAPRFLSLCIRYAGNRMEAEDVLQEGFVKIYKNLHKLRDHKALHGWMKRIFVHTALKTIAKRQAKVTSEALEDVAQKTSELGPISSMSEQEILRVVGELPEGYRLVFNLYAIEGYKHKEISELLDIQESTSRTQLLKARKLLQKKLRGFMTSIMV